MKTRTLRKVILISLALISAIVLISYKNKQKGEAILSSIPVPEISKDLHSERSQKADGSPLSWLSRNKPSDDPSPGFWLSFNNVLKRSSIKDLEAAAESLSKESGSINKRALFVVLSEISRQQPDLALKLMAGFDKDAMPDHPDAIVTQIAELDYSALASWLAKNNVSEGAGGLRVLEAVLDSLKADDQTIAIKAIGGLNEQDRLKMLSCLGAFLGRSSEKQNPRDILESVKAAIPPNEVSRFLGSFLYGVAKKNPEVALEMVSTTDDPADVRKYSMLIFDKWLTIDQKGAAKALAELPPTVTQSILHAHGNLEKLYQADPDSTLSALSQIALSTGVVGMFAEAGGLLAKSDVQKAIEWKNQFEDSPLRDQIEMSIYTEVAKSGIGQVETLLKTATVDDIENIVKGVGRPLGASNLSSGLSLLNSLPGDQRDLYFEEVVTGCAESDLSKASAFLVGGDAEKYRSEIGGAALDNMVLKIASTEAVRSPEAAVKWLADVPSSFVPQATFGIVSEWAKKDVAGAAGWLNSMKDSEQKRSGVSALIKELELSDPKSAQMWKDTLSKK